MHVRLNFIMPRIEAKSVYSPRFYSYERKDNPFVNDWIVGQHHEAIELEWSAVPNVGDAVSLLSENGTEIRGNVKKRIWTPALSGSANGRDSVYVEVEITNGDEITKPLY